jgi:hypothetical protein
VAKLSAVHRPAARSAPPPTPRGRRRRRGLAGLALLVGLLAAAAPAAARLSVIYDSSDVVAQLIGPQPDGSPGLDPRAGLLQQQPAPQVLPSGQQVWKVTSRSGSDATPSIAGLDATAMAHLLTDRIRRSGGHMVFIDELDATFAGAGGETLDQAMTMLASRPNPYAAGPGGLARQVHVYVPGVGGKLANPAAYGGAWHAMTLAGGVWLEAYAGSSQWTPEQWLAWPGAVARRLASLGGDTSRLHLVLFGGAGAATWQQALVGDACTLLANGPGGYRLGVDAPIFVASFRSVFGDGPAPLGPSPIACQAPPLLPAPLASALASALALPSQGFALGPGQLSSSRITYGVPQRVTVGLGPDPLGLAARFGADPAPFWAAAKARLTATAPGVSVSAPITASGTASLTVTAPAPGPIALTVTLSGAPIRAVLGSPTDIAASLAPYAPPASALDPVLANPNGWSLSVPLGYSAAPAGPVLAATLPRPPPKPKAARLLVGLPGPAVARRRGQDPKRVRYALVKALDSLRRPVPRARLVVRLPDGGGRRTRADAAGRALVRLSAKGGRLRVGAPGTRAHASARVPALRPPARRHPRRPARRG